MNKKKLAIVSHINPFSEGSGQVQRVYNTLLGLTNSWESVTIYTIDKNKSVTKRLVELEKLNIKINIVYLEKPKYLKLLAPFFYVLSFIGFGKTSNLSIPIIFNILYKDLIYNYDVVLFEYWHLHRLAKKVKENGIFVICDTHNILSGSYTEFLERKKIPLFYKNWLLKKYKHLEFNIALELGFNKIVAINKEEELIFLKKFHSDKVYYLPMGVKLPYFDVSKTDFTSKIEYNIIYYGGLANERNVADAYKVYDALTKLKNITFKYIIIGSNPSKFLKEISKKDNRIVITGYIENLAEAFKNADLAVIPFEGRFGFRSRLIELMHYGVPVFTTEDAIWGMGFENKKNVFINNNIDPILIEDILNDFELRKNIALNAKNLILNEYTFEKTYQKFSKDLIKMCSK